MRRGEKVGDDIFSGGFKIATGAVVGSTIGAATATKWLPIPFAIPVGGLVGGFFGFVIGVLCLQ